LKVEIETVSRKVWYAVKPKKITKIVEKFREKKQNSTRKIHFRIFKILNSLLKNLDGLFSLAGNKEQAEDFTEGK